MPFRILTKRCLVKNLEPPQPVAPNNKPIFDMTENKKTMLFFSNFNVLRGAHVKIFDYFNYTNMRADIKPILCVAENSKVEFAKAALPENVEIISAPIDADMFFFSGRQWGIPEAAGIEIKHKPVINIVQAIKHANPRDDRYRFLSLPAMRICVSSQIATSISMVVEVPGPLHTISPGSDVHERIDLVKAPKSKRVFIAGVKAKELARNLAEVLQEENFEVDLCIGQVPREEYLQRLAAAEIAVLLPMLEEGFFLPALEAMILGTIAIVPDCVGSRDFCIDGQTCLVPARTVGGLHSAVHALWHNPEYCDRLKDEAFKISAPYTAENEKLNYYKALDSYLREFQ